MFGFMVLVGVYVIMMKFGLFGYPVRCERVFADFGPRLSGGYPLCLDGWIKGGVEWINISISVCGFMHETAMHMHILINSQA